MANLSSIFHEDDPQSYIGNLCVYIKTNGLYKSMVTVGPFDFEMYDVSGARTGRKKWNYCMEGLDYIIYVADLNGYCRYLQEDIDAVCLVSSCFMPALTNPYPEPDGGIDGGVRIYCQPASYGEGHSLLVLEQG